MGLINKRLIITPKDFHFARWEVLEFRKYFKEVIETKLPWRILKKEDVLLCYAFPAIDEFQEAQCVKFGMLYPGWRFNPWRRQSPLIHAKKITPKYKAIFVNEGPTWSKLNGIPGITLAPYSASNVFVKSRTRTEFKRIIQVARLSAYKGREISEAAMKMMPYEWALYPSNSPENYHVTTKTGYSLSWSNLPSIYQQADGFLSPNMIGPAPKYEVDAKYNQSTMEAGLSGCIVFWHDAIELGKGFETVFEISLDPKEIAQKVQDVVSSIDLDKHSKMTSEEFKDKCSVEKAVKVKVDIMKRFL